MIGSQQFIKKYASIIEEEVNVKSVGLLPNNIAIKKSYIPIGSALSQEFGKDTGRIIAAAKQGNYTEGKNGILTINDNNDTRTLTPSHYEIRYSGIDETNQTIEDDIIIGLDLIITPELKAEGVAREISRFLNQLRKDVDYKVDQRITCFYHSAEAYLCDVMDNHDTFLKQEALLSTIEQIDANQLTSTKGDKQDTLSLPEGTITFIVKQ